MRLNTIPSLTKILIKYQETYMKSSKQKVKQKKSSKLKAQNTSQDIAFDIPLNNAPLRGQELSTQFMSKALPGQNSTSTNNSDINESVNYISPEKNAALDNILPKAMHDHFNSLKTSKGKSTQLPITLSSVTPEAHSPNNLSDLRDFDQLRLDCESLNGIFTMVIRENYPINATTNSEGQNLLHLVAKLGDAKLLNKIKDNFKDAKGTIDKVDNNGRTPLYYAIEAGNLDIMNALIYAGANFTAEDKDGRTPLYYAIEFYQQEIANSLIARGARSISDKGITPLNFVKSKITALVRQAKQINKKQKDTGGYDESLKCDFDIVQIQYKMMQEIWEYITKMTVKMQDTFKALCKGELKEVKQLVNKDNVRSECGDSTFLKVALNLIDNKNSDHQAIVEYLMSLKPEYDGDDCNKMITLFPNAPFLKQLFIDPIFIDKLSANTPLQTDKMLKIPTSTTSDYHENTPKIQEYKAAGEDSNLF